MSANILNFLVRVAALAPLASALIFAASLCVGLLQIRKGRENQLRATAIALWDRYLDRTLQYPRFAYPEGFKKCFDYKSRKFDGKDEEFERYEWFVGALIRTSNEILCSYDRSPERNNMVRRNIRYHREYITHKGHAFFKDLGPEIWKIVNEIADDHEKELEGEQTKS